MRVGSLFAGIGGFDLAARNVGWTTAWVSEIHPYASQVLAKHFPEAPNHGDITQIDFTRVEPVEVLCGGFPCQDISTAGKGAGITGARSGLWSHYARAIGELRPRYVVVENSPNLVARGLGRVLGDLAALGYDAEWEVLSACSFGASHTRERLFLLAYPHGPRQEAGGPEGNGNGAEVAERRVGGKYLQTAALLGRCKRGGLFSPEPNVGRMANGIPHRVDRLAGLGNAIVPQVAEVLFRAIQAHEESLK